MPHDLQQMREHPGSVKKRDLVAALTENGWTLRRRDGKHEVWRRQDGGMIFLPRSPKGIGTIREIVDRIIERNGR